MNANKSNRTWASMGLAILVLGATAGAAWALPAPVQTYYIPIPAAHAYQMFETINSVTTTNIRNVISISVNATNTLVVYDHAEDGFEADIQNPTQTTTRVWGDFNNANGIPPGFAEDSLNAGSIIALQDTIPVPHNPSDIRYSGGDRVTATKAVAVTFSCWPVDPGAVLADAIEVYDTTAWGTNFISPVGTNTAPSPDFFDYAGLAIMAGQPSTVVRIDRDANGTFDLTNTLGTGQAWLMDSGIVHGAQIAASKPVQAALLTGDLDSNYEARWFTLTPVEDWCFCGIVPVSTTVAGDPTDVFLYNQYTHGITVDVYQVSGTTSFTVTPKSTYRYRMPTGSGAQLLIRGQNESAPTKFYTAVAIIDADDNDNLDHDWGFTVPTLRSLSPQVLVGWGPGADTNSPSWTGTQNGSPVWVVARSNTTLYIDFDADPSTGPLTDINGNKYNRSTNVVAFQSVRIFDTNDLDQTGMRVYTVDRTPIAAAWGQDPANSSPNNPYLDMGTTVPSLSVFTGNKSYSLVSGDGDLRVEPGETIEYSLSLANESFNAIEAITLEDPLPPHVSYVLNSTEINGIPLADDGIGTPFPLDPPGSTNIPDVASFSNVVVTFQVVITNPFPQSVSAITNVGTFFTAEGDLTVQTETPVVQADLELVKNVNNPSPVVGSNVVFTITVTNRGPDAAEDVVVLDALPAGLSYVSHNGGAYVPGSGLWTIGTLAVGSVTQLQITATVTGGNAITNVAQVNVAGVFDPDSTPGNEDGTPYEDDEDDAVVTPVPQIDLELRKTANTLTPNVGGNVIFTLVATNRGPSAATGVTVEDVLPSGLAYVSHSGGAYVPGTGIWTIGGLAAGSSTTLQVTASVTNSGSIVNFAQVETANETDVDSTPGNNGGTTPVEDDESAVTLSVPAAIDLELAKSVSDATPDVADSIVYTLVLTNKGPNNATGVTVSDVLPAGLGYVSHVGPGTYVPGTGVWTLGGPMVPGASRILQITATVGASGVITNFAQVATADQYDTDSTPGNAPPYVEDDDDLAVISVAPAADLELNKGVNDSTPDVLDNVTFTIVVTNRGPDNATGVTVEDILPSGLAYVSHSGGAYVPGTGIWTIGNLAVGSVTSLQVTATVTNSGVIENIAQVETANEYDTDSTPGNDNPAEDDQDDATLTVAAAADLELAKTVDDATPSVGQSIVYTVTVTNRGPNNAVSVAVHDVLPAGMSYVSHVGPGTYAPGTGVWSLGGPMIPGASRVLQITALVTQSGTVTNYAQVSAAGVYDVDSTPSNAPPFLEDDDDFVVTVTPPAADLELTKTVDDSTPNVLDNVTFTVTVTNRGPDNATGVTVEDLLPAGLAYVSHSGGAYVPGTGIWTIGTLNVGSITTLQVTATVTNSGVIENIAQVETANEYDTDSTPGNDNPAEDDQDSALLQVPTAGDLELTKTVNNGAPNVGDNIVYTVVVTNRGPNAQQSVSVRDVLPAGLAYVSHSGGLYNDGTGIWSIGNLNAGSRTTLQITATVNASGIRTNYAQVWTAQHYDTDSTPSNAPPFVEDDDDLAVITTPPAADLELSKAVDNGNPNLFDSVTFTVTVTNRGPDNATGVTVEDVLPAGLEYVSHSGGAYVPGTGLWTIGGLAVGSVTQLQITATVTNSGLIENIAQVETANEYDTDSTPGNDAPAEDDQDNAFVSVGAAADLSLLKSVNDPAPNVGGSVTYTVIVSNSGPDAASGVRVEDLLPAGLSYVSHSGGTYTTNNGLWTIGDLAVGSTTTLQVTADVIAAGVFTNIAQVNDSDQYDPDSTPDNDDPNEDDQDDAVIRTPQADLELVKSVDDSTPNVTENVTFTIVVTNKGPDAATGVTVEDILPAGLLYVSHAGGAYDTNTSIWTIGGLAVGSSTSLQVTATVTNSGLIENIAQVEDADQYDPDSTPGNDAPAEDDQDNAVLNVPPASDLELTKDVDNATPAAGGSVTYTITVVNQGPDEGEGISVEDILPADVTYVSHANGSFNPGTGIWSIGDLAVGSSTSLNITVTVDIDGVITNVAQVETSDHFDPDSTPGNEDGTPYEDDEDDAVITASPTVDVELRKDVDLAEADPFENVTWTIVVTNKGPSAATGLTVYDKLPTNWVYVSDSSGGAYDTNTHIWTIGTLPAGGSTSLSIVAYATLGVNVMGHGPVPPGYTNIAEVWTLNEPDVDSTPGNSVPSEDDQDDAFIPVRAFSDLALTKDVSDPTPYLGQQIAYTVVVTNEGPQPAVGVRVEDVLPAGLTYVSNSLGAAYNAGSGIWEIGAVWPGASTSLTIWAQVNAIGVITNVAQVNRNFHYDPDSTPDNDAPAEDDQDDAVIDAQPLADVELTKTVDQAEADPFENVTWTISVTNKGPSAATGLTVYDQLPTNWVYVSHSGGTYDTNTHIWTIGSLPVGSATQLQIVAYATLGLDLSGHGPVPPGYTNIAQVWTMVEDDVDSAPGNSVPSEDDQDDAQIPIRAFSDLALTKSVNNPAPNVGDTIAYTIVVTNEGPQPAVGVRVEDVLPAGVTYVSNSLGGAYSDGTGIWDIGAIWGGASTSLTIWVTVDSPAVITNVAQVNRNFHYDPDSTPDNDDPNEDDQDDAVIAPQQADLELVKDGPEYVVAGANATFTITVTNRGPDAATGLTVEDVLPAGLSYVSHSGGAYDDGAGIWTIGGLAAGSVTSLQITATVTTTGVFENIAQVETADQHDPDSTPGNDEPDEDDQDNAIVTAVQSAVQIVKTVDGRPDGWIEPILSGSNVVYRYEVYNAGDTYLADLVVTDNVIGAVGVIAGPLAPGASEVLYATNLNVTASVTNIGVVTATPSDNDGIALPGLPDVSDDDDAVVVVVGPSIRITKLAGSAPDGGVLDVTPGTDVVYTYEVVNTGDVPLYDVEVTDDVLGPIAVIGTLLPGATNFVYATNLNVTADVTNIGTVTGDPNPPEQQGPQLPIVTDDDDAEVRVVHFVIEKEDLPDPVPPGAELSYTLWIANPSPHPVLDVVVTETYPPFFNFVGSVPAPDSGDNVWNLGTLQPGQVVPIVIDGTVSAGAPGGAVLTNVVVVGTSNAGTNSTTEETRVVTNPPPGETLIRITKRDSADPVGPGDPLVYFLRVENLGPLTATNVVVTETYDPLFTFVGAGPAPSSGNNVWSLGDLAAYAFREIAVTGTVSAAATNGTLLVDRVVADADNTPPSEDEEVTLVVDLPPPDVSKTDDVDPVVAGGTLIYTVRVWNASTFATVSNVVVVETYDAHFQFGSAVPAPMAGTSNMWLLGDLPPGYVTNIVITGTVLPSTPADATLFNTVEVFSDAGSRTVHETTDVIVPALNLTKLAGNAPDGGIEYTLPGSNVVYAYVVTNTGDTHLTITVTDNVIGVVGTVTALAPNAGAVLYKTSAIPASVTNIGYAAGNPVTAGNADLPGASDVYDHDDAIVQVVAPALNLVKLAGNAADGAVEYITSGQDVVYSYAVSNAGGTYVSSITVTDDVLGVVGTIPGPLAPGATATLYATNLNITADVTNIGVATGNPTDAGGNDLPDIPDVSDDDDAVVDVVAPLINLTKLAGDAPDGAVKYTAPGADVGYAYIVSNAGNTYLGSVLVTDNVLGVIGFLAGPLAPGQSTVFYETSSIPASVTNIGVVQANPVTQFGNDLPNLPLVTDLDDAVVVVVRPAVNLVKRAGDAPDGGVKYAAPGGQVVYSYAVSNAGDTYLGSLVVTDNVIGAVGTIPGPLAPGASATLYKTSAIPASVTNLGVVTANPVTAGGADLAGIADVTDSDDAIVLVAQLSIAKEDLPDPVHAGAPLSYTLWIANPSANPVQGVVVTETYPPQFSYVSANPAPDSGNNVWNLGTLQPGDVVPIVINGTVLDGTPAGTILTNRIEVTSNVSTSTAEETTLVVDDPPPGGAEIRITKRDEMDPVQPGSNLVYTIRVENFGPGVASNVFVIETYDPLFTFTGAGPAPSSGNNVWSLGDLAANDFREIVVTGWVSFAATDGTLVTNVVRASSDNTEPSEDDETTLVVTRPPPEVFKTDGPDPVFSGGTLTYTVTVRNACSETEPDTAVLRQALAPLACGTVSNVTVVEAYDARFQFQSAVPAPEPGTSNVWVLGDLEPGEEVEIVITGLVAQDTAHGAVLFNTVEVFSDSGSRTVHETTDVLAPRTLQGVFYVDCNENEELEVFEDRIQGVNVRLYRDANANSLLDGDPLIGATVTDVNGGYVFSNLWDGTWFVGWETNVALLVGATQTEGGNPDVIVLAGSDAVANQGFVPAVPLRTISGYLWIDLNANGLPDENMALQGLNGIQVFLHPVVGNVTNPPIANMLTGPDGLGGNGYYEFGGLALGDYVVKINLATVPPELQPDENDQGAEIGPECEVAAGFPFSSAPTPVTLAGLSASRTDGGVRVAWETAAEIRNLGFHVYRSDSADGERVRLTAGLIAGLGTGDGRAYEFVDAGADPSATLYYWVEDVSWDFETERHGPAVVYGEASGSDSSPALASFELEAQPALYRVRYEALKAAGVAIDAIDPAALKVLVDGEETALFVSAWRGPMKAGDYLLFYAADGVAEIRTGAEALRMEEVYAGPSDDAGDAWYGVATEEGTLAFETQAGILRYLLIGFADEAVQVLDVTDAARPKLLYGYSWLEVNGQAGVYLGYEAEKAKLFASGESAIIEVNEVETP